MTLVVDWCSRDAAKEATRRWHYSGKVPNGKAVCFGVWEDDRFIGSVVYGDGANPVMFAPYGLGYEAGCELVRVALDKHESPVSEIVARTIPFLKDQSPGLRLIVSFADPDHGHVGRIYQAMNWLYLGMSGTADEYVVNGKRMHGKGLRQTRRTHSDGGRPAKNVLDWARQVLDPDAQQIVGSSKHRYVLPLDKAVRRRILPFTKPYPNA